MFELDVCRVEMHIVSRVRVFFFLHLEKKLIGQKTRYIIGSPFYIWRVIRLFLCRQEKSEENTEVASRSGRLKYWFIRGGRQLGKKILALFHRFTQLLSLLYVYIYKDIYIHIYLSLENPDEIERFTFVRISRRNDSPNLSTFLLKINSSTKYFTCYWFSYSKEEYSISSSYSLLKYNFFHPESQSRSDKISRSYRDASNTTIIP